MPYIISVAEAYPEHIIQQDEVMELIRELFSSSFQDIDRYLKVFPNGGIEKRHFVKNLDWYKEDHSFAEKNDTYIEHAVELGSEAVKKCMTHHEMSYDEIEAIIFVSSTGIATPSIEARMMNVLPFSEHTRRIPIWGLGCAGGAAGISRAYDYCLAHPQAKVLVLTVELCSLTFQKNDQSKSNLIGTSLFADGVACTLVVGDEVRKEFNHLPAFPKILSTQSTTMKNSIDVMGWEVKNDGLYVVFSRDIPSMIESWFKPNVEKFLKANDLQMSDLSHLIAHPGGKKVIEAYGRTLQIPSSMLMDSLDVLRQFGNMSSTTIMYVLNKFLTKAREGELGLMAALGPGFSSELLLVRWE